jgi:hypothetical protein
MGAIGNHNLPMTATIPSHQARYGVAGSDYEAISGNLDTPFGTQQNHSAIQQRPRYEPDDLERLFNHLVQWVLTDTRSESSTLRIAIHPAYQQIIGLGQPAVPLLLREVERRSGRWFWALKAITRQDPVQPNDRGKTQKMINAWLSWGKKQGYQW